MNHQLSKVPCSDCTIIWAHFEDGLLFLYMINRCNKHGGNNE